MALNADTFRVRSDFSQRGRLDGLPLGTRGGTAFHHTFPLDGEYEFKIDVGQASPADPHQLEIAVDGERVRLLTLGRKPPEAPDRFGDAALSKNPGLTFRAPVKAGPREIAATFVAKPAALLDGFREPRLGRGAGIPTIGSVTITGPFSSNGAADTPSRRRLFVCYPANAGQERACAAKILTTFVRRAYRRPSTEADLAALWPFYETGHSNGGFDGGIELAVRRALVSPEFLFRIERDPAGGSAVYRVSALELAARLSFFLWSSIPDDELLAAAESGTLRQPAVLERQVQRMLADPRSAALSRNFAGQWLDLRTLPTVAPDGQLFPDFTDNLRHDFAEETELFFDSLVRENRSALELLTANYTFVNERLARHYGLPHIFGSRFRRVTITDENRFGILGQGSFLTVTSHADRTSVVGRGKWILEHLLGSPPPPPPPNVSANLPQPTPGGKVLTMRERLAQHRANPVCASCHNRMDPLGFALENFDATGQWRTKEGFQTIDTSAVLPDGSTFDSPAGLRVWLMRYPEQIVTAATEKLLAYALGRGVDYTDAPAVRAITRRAARSGYSFSSLITGVVDSVPFQMRRAPADVKESPTEVAAVR
jgi:hypothetical protein